MTRPLLAVVACLVMVGAVVYILVNVAIVHRMSGVAFGAAALAFVVAALASAALRELP